MLRLILISLAIIAAYSFYYFNRIDKDGVEDLRGKAQEVEKEYKKTAKTSVESFKAMKKDIGKAEKLLEKRYDQADDANR